MTRLAALVLCITFVVTNPAASQPTEWKDPAKHVVSFVTVDEGVQLEVLDWGGSGPAIVLLAGLGDTAHVFDDFAPMLTPRYRVVGVTRRAHGRSSAPAAGYDFARLAEDVVRAIDAVGVKNPVVVGHSFAGEEMHVIGARHAAKVAGLVYVDAAFNRADGSDDYDALAKTLPSSPRPGPAELASFAALRAYLEKTQGFAGPEAFLRARWVANADGTVARMWAPPPPIFQAISAAMKAAYSAYNPEPVRVPALAIYAVPKSAGDLMRPWYPADDAKVRQSVETLLPLARARFDRHAKWFAKLAERSRVAEIAGPHHLVLSHPREVAERIDEFMSLLRPAAAADLADGVRHALRRTPQTRLTETRHVNEHGLLPLPRFRDPANHEGVGGPRAPCRNSVHAAEKTARRVHDRSRLDGWRRPERRRAFRSGP